MANTVIFSSQPNNGPLALVPNQTTTLTVVASANFIPTGYTYQWKRAAAGGVIGSATNINGATGASYTFEPAIADNGYKYYCTVTTTGGSPNDSEDTSGIVINVASEATQIYHKWVPKGNDPNQLKESGAERFRRMHNLGYC